jgi:ubiquinol-cytochrome c reductase cytochrome c1 subunit
MKKILFALIASLALAGSAFAAEGGIAWDKAPNTLNDLSSLQNGAKLFVNYCLNCHSAAYMRYNRLHDIGLTDEQIKDNLLFTSQKVGETMEVAIDPKQAKDWFGAVPPDLTLVARSRAGYGGTGADYLYTYLRTFYRDPTRPTGWNNLVFPNVGMPHVLWQLQGEREPQFEEREVHGEKEKVFTGWKQLTPGTMSSAEYDRNVGDLVNFLQWMSEPAQSSRVRVGVGVMIFLLLFTLVTWRLNAAYWKDVR